VGAGWGKWRGKNESQTKNQRVFDVNKIQYIYFRIDVDHDTSAGEGHWMDGSSPCRITHLTSLTYLYDLLKHLL
jgi:hypothetical protein